MKRSTKYFGIWETTLSPVPNLMNGFDIEDFKMLKRVDRQMKLNLGNVK